MFYSETLLSKTGPLARVWLSANLERKLSKTHILQTNVDSAVGAIVAQETAPLALRLSGQLLLGVVRIYSRKARYLLEDCNEALMKIKMAFRPGNVDLPSGTGAHSAAQLTLPDVITELDLLLPDPTSLLADLGELNLGRNANLSQRDVMLQDSSSYMESSMQQGRGGRGTAGDRLDLDTSDDVLALEDDELELDIGFMPGEERRTRGNVRDQDLLGPDDEMGMGMDDTSIEIGRRAPVTNDYDQISDVGIGGGDMDIEMGGLTPKARPADRSMIERSGLEEDLGLDFGGGDDFRLDIGDRTGMEAPNADLTAGTLGLDDPNSPFQLPIPRNHRDSMSPLSSVRSSVERELSAELHGTAFGDRLDITFADDSIRLPSEDPGAQVQRQVHARKRKVAVDEVTEIRAKQIKSQQEDRSKILKEPSFLPRDPSVLALVTLQRTGGFASSVFYPKNIHPDLAGLLSPEFVKRMAAAKRKREQEGDGVAGADSPAKRVQLELDDSLEKEMEEADAAAAAGDISRRSQDRDEENENADEGLIDFPQGDDFIPNMGDDDFDRPAAGDETVDRTFVPEASTGAAREEDLLDEAPPSTSGPISQQTVHAVHLLRNTFDPSTNTSTPGGSKKSIKFQDLLSPTTTTRIDATKMFFEVLVLATKDAVRVKQTEGFGDITIGAKKGLWGKWAEERDEQQIAEEEEKRNEEEAARVAMEKRRASAGGQDLKGKGRTVDVVVGRGGERGQHQQHQQVHDQSTRASTVVSEVEEGVAAA